MALAIVLQILCKYGWFPYEKGEDTQNLWSLDGDTEI